MLRLVWMPVNSSPTGSVAAPDGLTATLRAIKVGQQVLVPGRTANGVRNHIRAARRGTDKWFEGRTLTTGAEIRRVA